MGFKVWECMVCGFIYDEREGCIEEGIAPGTLWQDIPDDWYCPDCGVSKQDFVMRERAANAVQPTVSETLDTSTQKPTAEPVADHTAAYKQWQCIVCGFIYDEAKGWPEEGIAAGTLWQDVPDDWLCPDCGVTKADFSMVERVIQPTAETSLKPKLDIKLKPLVVIGTGLAAYNLVREFRQYDTSTPVVMISQDDGSYYSKPQLSTAFSAGQTAGQLVTHDACEMAQTLHADIRIFTTVTAVDTKAKTLDVNGATLAYGQLVFATGASPRPLNIAGNAAQQVYTVNNLQDYQRFKTALVNKQKVLIIGAGLIGSEYANDLIQAGYQVDVVEPAEQILASLLPEAASQAVQSALESAGVCYHLGAVVDKLNVCTGDKIEAVLSNNTSLQVDTVLCATGLVPNAQLAQQAGINVNKGIEANKQLKTSADDVYAIGDCAEVGGQLRYYVAPLMHCASVLAKALNKQTATVNYPLTPVMIKTTLCPVAVCLPDNTDNGEWLYEGEGQNISAAFMQNKQLTGFVLTGELVAQKHEWLGRM